MHNIKIAQIRTATLVCGIMLSLAIGAAEDGGLVIGRRPEPKPVEDAPAGGTDWGALAANLKDARFERVRDAAIQLAASGNAASLQYLWDLFNHGDGQRRALAVQCIGILGVGGNDDNLERIALEDPSQTVRRAACSALTKLKAADDAAKFFAKVAADQKFSLLQRWRALAAIAFSRGKGAGEILVKWLNSGELEMATEAADDLGILGDVSQAGALMTALETKDPELRPAIVDALEQVSGKKFRYDLIKWTRWRDEIKARLAKATTSESGANPVESASVPDTGYDAPFHKEMLDSPIDFVIAYDTTGSMANGWPDLYHVIEAILDELEKRTPSLRVATIKYRSMNQRKATYSIEPHALTRQLDVLRKEMRDTTFGGGSGGPQLALRYAIGAMHWRASSRKVVLVIGDIAPQSDDTPDADPQLEQGKPDEIGVRACMQAITESWRMDGVLVNTLYYRSVHGEQQRDSYRLMGLAGAGHFYEFDKAERHLVDKSTEKFDSKKNEQFSEMARKLCTPRETK